MSVPEGGAPSPRRVFSGVGGWACIKILALTEHSENPNLVDQMFRPRTGPHGQKLTPGSIQSF